MNKKANLFAIMTLSLVGGVGLTACDDDDDLEDIVDERLDDLDIDDDLVVTESEWFNGFVVFDDDDDQLLVFSEFRFNGDLFDLADFNCDAYVTESEWDALVDPIDTDNNGVISESELAVYF
jgi:hypothetical protein